MHIQKFGTIAIALCALAGTSANALTTTQMIYASVLGNPNSSVSFAFDQFNVAGQILDSVTLNASVYSQHYAYLEATQGFWDIQDVDNNLTVFFGIDTNTGISNYYDTTQNSSNGYENGTGLGMYGWDCNSPGCDDGGQAYFSGDFRFSSDHQFYNYVDTGLSYYIGNGQFSIDTLQSSITNHLDFGYAYPTTYDYSIYSDVYVTYTFESHDAPILPGVPEPASWALMISGFGLIGTALRRRREALAA